MNTPSYLVIHHTASKRDTTTVAAVNEFHRTKDWDTGPAVAKAAKSSLGYFVQYHYFITADGKVTQCAQDNEIRWHAGPEANTRSIAICLAGWFDDGHDDKPTEAQIASLRELVQRLKKKYQISPLNVVGHRAFMQKTCPGTHVTDSFLRSLAEGVVMPDSTFAARFNGRVLVAADDHGRKWYVWNGKRYEIDKAPAFEKILQQTFGLALWIIDTDLQRIPLG